MCQCSYSYYFEFYCSQLQSSLCCDDCVLGTFIFMGFYHIIVLRIKNIKKTERNLFTRKGRKLHEIEKKIFILFDFYFRFFYHSFWLCNSQHLLEFFQSIWFGKLYLFFVFRSCDDLLLCTYFQEKQECQSIWNRQWRFCHFFK